MNKKLKSSTFPTKWYNTRKVRINQVMLAIILASMSGINRIKRISSFSEDGLVRVLLRLNKAINEDTLSATLKKLGEKGARKLQMLLLRKNSLWLRNSGLTSITLDADSTVKLISGNQDQEGAAKGFNTTKKGDKSYYPLLVFISEKNLEGLLKSQTWMPVKGGKDIASCEFTYKVKGWSKSRVLKAMRSVKERAEVEYFGKIEIVPIYQYACYISSYDVDALELHNLYKQRSTSEFCDERDQYKTCFDWRAKKQNLQSETWIEQVKGQAMAGSTLRNNFWANDILCQLSVLAYNISVMMRQKRSKYKRQEHFTLLNLCCKIIYLTGQAFIDWFIAVPGEIVSSGHQIEIKMYEHCFYKADWKELDISTGSIQRKLFEAA